MDDADKHHRSGLHRKTLTSSVPRPSLHLGYPSRKTVAVIRRKTQFPLRVHLTHWWYFN